MMAQTKVRRKPGHQAPTQSEDDEVRPLSRRKSVWKLSNCPPRMNPMAGPIRNQVWNIPI